MTYRYAHIVSGLGLVAKSQRSIKPGTQYNKYFNASLNEDPMLSNGMRTLETVETIGQIATKYKNQSAAIAKALDAGQLEKTLENIFNFCYDHIAYELDKDGVEQLRTPNRVWQDKKADCDCYSLFISSMLLNLGIAHAYRVVKINSKPNYQHIYVIVPKDQKAPNVRPMEGTGLGNRNAYWVVDPVVDSFNEEPSGISYKYDHPMIPVQLLNGIDEHVRMLPTTARPGTSRPTVALYGQEFNGLGSTCGGLGCPAPMDKKVHATLLCKEFSDRLKVHIKNTLTELEKHRGKGTPAIDLLLIDQLHQIHDVWDNPEQRLATIIHAYKKADTLPVAKTFFEALAFQAAMDAKGLAGLAGFKDWWKSNIGQPINKAFQKIEDAFAQAWDGLKHFTGRVGEKLKKLGQLFLRWNPVSAMMRIGLLASIVANVLKIRFKVMPYYENPKWEQAKAKGISWTDWFKARHTYELLHKNTVTIFKASEKEFISALRDKKLIFDNSSSDDIAKVEAMEAVGNPLFIGNLYYNYYGENNDQRLSPTSIVLTDTVGENGWVVLVNGIPTMELVALKLDSPAGMPGQAYGMDAQGNFYETANGNWHRATTPNLVIPPLEKYKDRYFTGNVTVPQSAWKNLHIQIFKEEKAKANGQTPAPGGNNVVTPGGGTFNLDDLNRSTPTVGGLGAITQAFIATCITGAATILSSIALIVDKKNPDPEPTAESGNDTGDNGRYLDPKSGYMYDPRTGKYYDPSTGEEVDYKPKTGGGGSMASFTMPLLVGVGILGLAIFGNTSEKKKGLGCPHVDPPAPEPALPDPLVPLAGTKSKKKSAAVSRKKAVPAGTTKKAAKTGAPRGGTQRGTQRGGQRKKTMAFQFN